ncbi:hypothetical protein SEPCBS119000_006746, partial [Sporothrix epigloea]
AKRDAKRMRRYDCKGLLTFKTLWDEGVILLHMRHKHHTIYDDISLTPEAQSFVDARVASGNPKEIRQLLISQKIPGYKYVTIGQVYYQWRKANESRWRRDADQFISTRLLLAEMPSSDYRSAEYTKDHVRGFAIFCQATIQQLGPVTREVAIDATFGTNNAGMDLFAVLAEVHGTGVPLAYLLLEKKFAGRTNARGTGAIIAVLVRFLEDIKKAGFNPTFFLCDKDPSEIAAISEVFPRWDSPFYDQVQRQRSCPFWKSDHLVLLDPVNTDIPFDGKVSASTSSLKKNESSDEESDSEEESDSDEEAIMDDEILGSRTSARNNSAQVLTDSDTETDPPPDVDEVVEVLDTFRSMVIGHNASGDPKYFKFLSKSLKLQRQIIASAREEENRRTMPKTWDKRRMFMSNYYQPLPSSSG